MAPIELETEDKLEYSWFPVGPTGLVFRVKAANDAHLALTSSDKESDPMLEVFIGGWKNTKSVIRKNRTKPDVVEVDTPEFLTADDFRGFWMRWSGNQLTVGKEGEAAPFMSHEIDEPFPINFVGVCTGWGASGSWIVESPAASSSAGGGGVFWVPVEDGNFPENALIGGHEPDGEPILVGRTSHEGALLPGKVVKSHNTCYIAYAGGEHPKQDFEVLVGEGQWVAATGADIPPNALPAGESENGEPLFVGRVPYEGSLTVGKVHPSHAVCYISFGGQELGFDSYEVLVA